MILQNLALQMLFGAMTGYITNDFAIEMLFEKRFGLGGVIPKTKDQFIDNIANLVEKDIITQEMIKEEIQKPEFDDAIREAISDFFKRSLLANLPDIPIMDMKGSKEALANISSYINEKLEHMIEQTILALDEGVKFNEILNDNQIRYASEQVFDEVIISIKESQLAEKLMYQILIYIKEEKMQSLTDWVSFFIEENRAEIEAMLARSIVSGVAKMGPMMAMLAGGISVVAASIPKDIVDYISDRKRLESFIVTQIDKLCRQCQSGAASCETGTASGETGTASGETGTASGETGTASGETGTASGETGTASGENADILVGIKDEAVKFLKKNRTALLESVQKKAADVIEGLNARMIIEGFDLKSKAFAVIEPKVMSDLLSNTHTHNMYRTLMQNTDGGRKLQEHAFESATGYIKNNASRLLAGRIKAFVVNNLSRYDEKRIKETARSFIGKNLRPIAYFGAFLGTIVGAGLALFASPISAENQWISMAVHMLAFGVLGWATNVIAISMLFRPYRKYRLLPIFSPGYIMKNKPALATSLGIFIDREIISGKIITEWFSGGKSAIKEKLAEKIGKDRFEVLRRPLQAQQDDLADYLLKWELDLLKTHKASIAEQLTELINKIHIGGLMNQNHKNIADIMYNTISNYHQTYKTGDISGEAGKCTDKGESNSIKKAADEVTALAIMQLIKYLSRPENTQKISDHIYKNTLGLQNIPFLPQASLQQILLNVTEVFITEELHRFTDKKNSVISDALLNSIDVRIIDVLITYVSENMGDKRLGRYLLDGETKGGIAQQVAGLAENEIFIQSEMRNCNMLIHDVISHESFMLGHEFVHNLTQITADSFVDTVARNIGTVLRSINFAEITEEQVMKLDGREVHNMFNSFMKKYFIKIRRYGFVGAAFGIHIISSIALMVWYWVWNLLIRPKSS